MRFLACCLLLLFAVSPAAGQEGVVERIQVIRTGLWTMQNGVPQFTRATTTVPAAVGALFGVEWRTFGAPVDATATLKLRWLYPDPGLRHPVTRTYRKSDEFEYAVAVGGREITYLELSTTDMIVPGKWVLEIGAAGQPLLRQEFNVR